MAGEVQLKLQASLDLAFLRSQLASLGSLAKGYNLPIVAKLDTKQVDAAIKKVSKEIRININDSQLDGLTKRLGSVKQQLESLKAQDNKIEIGVAGRASLSEREARKVKSDLRSAILGSEKKLYIPTSIKPVISRADIRSFKNEVRNKIGTITIDVKANLQAQAVKGGAKTQAEIDADVARGLQAISAMGEARMQGGSAGAGVTEAARRAQLRAAIEDLTVAQLRQVAKQMEVGGVSKLRKGDLINKIVADASIEMVRRYLDPQAMMRPNRAGLQQVLDTLARGVFHMLGLDPASMRRQAAERRALPPINWPAQVPQRQIEIGPSSTGRALPQGAIPGVLPGTSYVSQKRLVGDILSPSLKEALRGAANAFVDVVRSELNSAVRQVSVRDLGTTAQAALQPSRIAGLLPSAVGRTPSIYGTDFAARAARQSEQRASYLQRRIQQAYERSAERGAAVMGQGGALAVRPQEVALGQPGFMRAPAIPGGGGRGTGGGRPPGGDGGGFRDQMGFGPMPRPIDMRVFQQARVPLAGAMRELASELGEATKQVLLFGTAYKGLAFFLNLPRQAFDAAKALATYENQLRSVTSATGTFEQSSAFVENLAARFNVPLDSARQGFVRLFASMQPAGFGQGQIENLFTGIASATATFGLSADQVERVMNAFSQMASKGQIMAEELKGQLGDVLPGSLALFAEAAQMSIPEFTKAMEDGAFKGKAMQQVLDNVAVLMNQRFGPAAQNASKTLQGALNQIQNNLQLMYESLAPVVNELASAFGPAINSLLKDTTSAVKALTGTFVDNEGAMGALAPRAEALYLFFKDFGPSVVAAASSLGSFASSLQVFIGPLSIASKGLLDFISLPIVSRAALYATVLGALNGAFVLLARTGIASAIAAFVRFAITLNVSQLNVYIAGLRTMVAVLVSMATTANAARLAITGLKIALVSLGAGAVLLAIDAIAQSLLGVGNSAKQSQNDVARLNSELNNLAEAGLAEEAGAKYLEANTKLAAARKQNAAALAALRRAEESATAPGADPFMSSAAISAAQSKVEVTGQQVTAAIRDVETTRRARGVAVRRRGQMQQATSSDLQPIDLSAGDQASKKSKKTAEFDVYDRSQLDFISQQLEQEKLALERRRQAGLLSETAYKIALAELELESAKAEQAERLRLARLAINRENLAATDKALKLKDAEIAQANELSIAQDKYNVAIEGATRELAEPFNDALSSAKRSIEEQQMLLESLQIGIENLTPDQEAYLKTQELTTGLQEDEIRLVQDKIAAIRLAIEEQLKLNNAVQQERNILRLANTLEAARAIRPDDELRIRLGQEGFTEENLNRAFDLSKQIEEAEKYKENMRGIAASIGDAFGNAFKGIVTGASSVRETLADMFQSIADSFADMVARMIAEWAKTQLLQGFQSVFSTALPALGATGANFTPVSSLPSVGSINPVTQFPITGFANGGIVTGPTMGLIGEGRFNEAVVPLPDGKSIPVDLGNGGANQIVSNITVNVNNGQAQSDANSSNSTEFGRRLEGAVKQVIVNEMRPGGVLMNRR